MRAAICTLWSKGPNTPSDLGRDLLEAKIHEEHRNSNFAQGEILKMAIKGVVSPEMYLKWNEDRMAEERAKVAELIEEIQRQPVSGPSEVSSTADNVSSRLERC